MEKPCTNHCMAANAADAAELGFRALPSQSSQDTNFSGAGSKDIAQARRR